MAMESRKATRKPEVEAVLEKLEVQDMNGCTLLK
jgi:hypothetical protein